MYELIHFTDNLTWYLTEVIIRWYVGIIGT